MRKVILLLTVALLAAFLAACGAGQEQEQAGDDSISIVTTIFPEYDWAQNILGDNPSGAQLHMLLDSGVDLHSFQPTSEDMMTIAGCDVFVYVGGESDEWVEDALAQASNKDMIAVNLLEVLGDQAKEEEVIEGMQEEEEGEEGEEGPELDEHVWLSLKNASLCCEAIEEAIAQADPDNADAYEANLKAYLDQLTELDEEYREATGKAPVKTLLFGDRFPFRYLTDEYGLDYYAAFVGCSAETEASFETVKFLAEKLDELGLKCVMTIEGSDQKLAKTIIDSTKKKDQQILTMNSMQSVTASDTEAGASYLEIMRDNLEVLKQALQ